MSNRWPPTRAAQLAWLETRIANWTSQSGDIGLNDDLVGELNSQVSAARMAYDAMVSARAAAIAATAAWRAASEPMAQTGGGAIKTIRAFAQVTGDPMVYAKAEINPPSGPSPAPDPTMPLSLVTDLENQGAVLLTWKSTNPAAHTGVSFTIYRKMHGETSYKVVGATGEKKFVDVAVPAGTHWATYMVRAVRGGKMSPFSEPSTINFGNQGADGDALTLAA